MKKLIGFLIVVLLSCPVFAAEWQSAIYDNVVNDISVVGNKVYVATNGGIEVLSKDSINLPSESTPWKVYTTVSGNLPGNFVKSIAARSDGYIFAGGDGWLGWLPDGDNIWPENTIKRILKGRDWLSDIVITKRGVYATILPDGLYYNGGGMWEKIPLNHNVFRIAAREDGTICGTFMGNSSFEGVFLLDTAGEETIINTSDSSFYGPLNISVCDSVVIVSYVQGLCVVHKNNTLTFIPYGDLMAKNDGVYPAYFKGRYYAGYKEGDYIVGKGGLWCYDSSGWKQITSIAAEEFGNGINCLATDGEKLYIGTNNKMWVHDGSTFDGNSISQMSVTGIRYPHDNNITHINRDNTGRILVGSSSGGYRYDVDANSPSLNSSAQNVYGEVVVSFVDKDGAQWVGGHWYLKKNGVLFDMGGGLTELLEQPFWLVGDSVKSPWLIHQNPNRLLNFRSDGTVEHMIDFPKHEKILSVSSTGKRLWIGTDSSVYSYDFNGNWTYRKLHYSSVRCVAGDPYVDGAVWIGDGGYQGGTFDVKYLNINSSGAPYSWPYPNRKVNSLYLDLHGTIWACTDSGVYYKDPINLWKPVSLRTATGHTLADDYVNTIYVDSATDAVWFGTAGGLTVWHRPNSTSVTPAIKTGMKNLSLPSGQEVTYFDLSGRKISPNSIKGLARGQIIFCRVNGVTVRMNLNLIRQYR